jgi:hypothetical protein
MTSKQKIKSIKQKMQRIENNNPDVDFQLARKHFYDIEKWFSLNQELFHAEFELNHCQTCGKKLKE